MSAKIDGIEFCALSEKYYKSYLEVCRRSNFGCVLLPNSFHSYLWGTIVLKDENVIGGWVGTLRGNIPIVSYLAKGVWFDSYPIIVDELKNEICSELVDYTKRLAKKSGIVIFNLTHWVRNEKIYNFIDEKQNNATFLIELKKNIDLLWNDLESQQRNKVRKGEKNNIQIEIYKINDALPFLDDFQKLRQETQKRAIKRNEKSTMLLKSKNFFTNILLETNSTLFLAKYEDVVVSVALMIQSGRTVYYYSGGSDIDINKKTGASALLIWKAIEYFQKNQDVHYFDMGGVPVAPGKDHPAYGVYTFKKSFGGDYKEFDSGKIIIVPLKFKLLNLLLKQRKILRLLSRKV